MAFSGFKLTDAFRLQRYFQRVAPSGGGGAATIDIAGHGITSLQAVGSLAAKANEILAGLATSWSSGSHAIKPRVASTSIVSAEAIGSDAIKTRISSAGIVSAQAVGSDILTTKISASGIATAEVLGSDAAKAKVAAAGIVTAEALGSDAAKASVAASNIISAEAFGAPEIAPEEVLGTIRCRGIESAELFGLVEVSAVLVKAWTGGPPGASSTVQRVRYWSVTPAPITISPRSIESSEAFGSPSAVVVQSESVVRPAGVESEEVHGQPGLATLLAAKAILSIESEEMCGHPGLATLLAAKAILSEETIGIPLSDLVITTTGIVAIDVLGVPSAELRKWIYRAAARVGVRNAATVVGIHRASARVGVVAKHAITIKHGAPVVIGKKKVSTVIRCKKDCYEQAVRIPWRKVAH